MRYTNSLCILLLMCVRQSKQQIEQLNETQIISDKLKVNYTSNWERISINIVCTNYNSLMYFNELSNIFITTFDNFYWISLKFVICFNNVTNHENYRNFTLKTIFNSINPPLNESKSFKVEIIFDQYGMVDSDKFFENVNLNQLHFTIVTNVGLTNTKFFQSEYDQTDFISLKNVNQINFDDFRPNNIRIFELANVTILNFTKSNLGKFPKVKFIEIVGFKFDDDKILNVPRLFDQNERLHHLLIQDSAMRLILHDALFNGAHELQNIVLINIKIEIVPKTLFSDLRQLHYLDLTQNNIKILDSNTFINNPLNMIRFGHKELFSSGIFENLLLSQPDTNINIRDSPVTKYDDISALVQHPNVTAIMMEKCDLADFDVSEFNKIQNRANTINIYIYNINVIDFPLTKFQDKNITLTPCVEYNLAAFETINAIINIQLSSKALDLQCSEVPNIYLNDSNILIKLKGPINVHHLREH